MLAKLREIPDTAEEFTGFAIEWDLIAGLFPRSDPYVATGSATVRNVILPAAYTHIGLPDTRHLATDPVTRAWIEAYAPDGSAALPDDARRGHHQPRPRRRHLAQREAALDDRSEAARRCTTPGRRVKGRLNLFQAAMLRWRDLHPYNAIHVVRIDRPLDAARLKALIARQLDALGLTGFMLDVARAPLRVHGRTGGGRARRPRGRQPAERRAGDDDRT